MKLSELVKNVNVIEYRGDLSTEISDVTSDSRCVGKGTAFVCIRGFISDGHDYALEAWKKGASAIVALKDAKLPSEITCPVIRTDDTRYAIAMMADTFYGHPSGKMTVIGVTGTKGKTTTTCMIKKIFDYSGKKTGLIGTMKNMVGTREIPTDRTTPEALVIQKLMKEMVDEGVSVCVMEISSQGLNLSRVAGTKIDVGAFTNLSRDHIGATEHKDMDDYANAKSKLFKMCGKGVFNIDSDYCAKMTENATCEINTVSVRDENATFRAVNIKRNRNSTEYDILPYGIHMNVPIPGTFSVYNSLEAFACAVLAGADPKLAAEALSDISVPGKAEIVPTGSDFTVMIDYAHNPDSFENIIKTVKEFANRTVFLFGCGGDRNRPREAMGKTAGTFADFSIITSDNPRSEDPASIVRDLEEGMKKSGGKYICIVDRKQAIEYAIRNAQPGDVIILAGKGHETYQILKDKTIHFDEREVVAEILGKMRKEGTLR